MPAMAGAARTIGELLALHAARSPAHAAIRAPQREALTYAALYAASERIGGFLRERGIGARDRVALALPNGPDAAVAFLAVAATASCAPLNPSYKENDFV